MLLLIQESLNTQRGHSTNMEKPLFHEPFKIGSRTKGVDYVYKRCYVDKSGNTIDPRTPWDELLKYYQSWKTLIPTGSQPGSIPVPIHAEKIMRQEETHRRNKARSEALEGEYLGKRANKRKRQSRQHVHELERQYLASI